MKTLLVGIAKMENLYIREWIEYHLNLGFDYILLGDNNEPDGECLIDPIEDYVKSGKVGVIDIRSKDIKQMDFYNYVYSNHDLCDGFDWILFLDIDEFLVLHKDKTIQEYLSRDCFKDFNCIKIHWQIYTDNNLLHYDNRPVFERFTTPATHYIGLIYSITKEERDMNWFVKSIVRPFIKNTIWDDAPQPVPSNWNDIGLKVCNNAGEALDRKYIDETCVNEINRELAQINHYRTKTIEEYITNKCTRGWPIQGCDDKDWIEGFLNLNFFWNINGYSEEKDKVAKELARKYNFNFK